MRSGREGGRDAVEEDAGRVGGSAPGSPVWVNLFLRLCLRGGELVWRLPGMNGGELPPSGSDLTWEVAKRGTARVGELPTARRCLSDHGLTEGSR
jgi:hypothetical protein